MFSPFSAFSLLGSPDPMEVVFLEVVSDFLAEHGSVCVGGAEMDTGPYPRVDYLFEYV